LYKIIVSILTKIFGDANEKYLKKLQPLVNKINSLEKEFGSFSNEQLKAKTAEFRNETRSDRVSLDGVLPEAFALVREAAKRMLNQRHFDVQLLGGIILHRGNIAEMKTGEGKTLVATLPAYLNALEGKGVHIITVNDYLARRDTIWMGQIYHLLGLNVGCIIHDTAYMYDPEYKPEIQNSKFKIQNDNSKLKNDERDEIRDTVGGFKVIESYLRPCSRKEAYAADITYGTNNEFGFDYLRDNMAYDLSQVVQRGFNYAIVDEVDSILIDEARTPLIISAPDMESSKWYQEFARFIPKLDAKTDYEVDEKMKAVTLTEVGINKVEKLLGMGNIYEEKGIKYVHHLEQALRAEVMFQKDRDYVLKPARNASPPARQPDGSLGGGHSDAGGDELISMDVTNDKCVPGKCYVLVVTENGFGKRTDLREYKIQGRGGSGILTARITPKTGSLASAMILTGEEEDLIVISQKGHVIRTKIASISKLNRATQGVRIMKLDPGDKVASAACI